MTKRLIDKLNNKSVKIKGISYAVSLSNFEIEAPSFGNYFDVNSNKKLTFHPKPENQLFVNNDQNRWCKEGRQELKAGKLLNYLFEYCDVTITSEEIEISKDNEVYAKVLTGYIEQFAASLGVSQFNILESNDIANIYDIQEAENSGTLNSSCMRSEKGLFTEISSFYENLIPCLKNSFVSVLYTFNEQNELTSRALLWKNVNGYHNNEKITFDFIDRIYGTEEAVEAYKQYAIDHNFGYKVHQSYQNHDIAHPEYGTIKNSIYIDLKNCFETEYAPYMDTFKYVNSDFELTNDYSSKNTIYSFENTDGSIETSFYECYDCGCRIINDNYYNAQNEIYCCDCYSENFTSCYNCDCEIDIRNDTYAQINRSGHCYCENCITINN